MRESYKTRGGRNNYSGRFRGRGRGRNPYITDNYRSNKNVSFAQQDRHPGSSGKSNNNQRKDNQNN